MKLLYHLLSSLSNWFFHWLEKYYQQLGPWALLFFLNCPAYSQISRPVAGNLTAPWDIEWLGNQEIIFSEIDGTISKVNLNNGKITTLFQFDNLARELQAGLLGLALHPDFKAHPLVYAACSAYRGDDIILRIVELRYDPRPPSSLSFSKILVDNIPAAPTDLGGRLLTTPEGKLFLSTGDNELPDNAQDTSLLQGKILRFNLDGSIPADNPFPDSPVWAYGLRNPQGLTMALDSLFCTEHGTMDNDEINRVGRKQNLGWPLFAGFQHTRPLDPSGAAPATQHPLKTWTPTIAPASLTFYHHEKYPALKNCFLLANLFDQSLKALRYNPLKNEISAEFDLLSETAGRLRDVLVSPDGRIFIATSNADTYGAAPPGSDFILEFFPSALSPDPMTESLPLLNTAALDSIQLDSSILEIRILAQGLIHPWDMTWGVDNRIWFTENGGFIKRLDPASGLLDTILHLADCHFSWGNPGIYSLAFHPDYPREPFLYLHFTNSPTNSKLVRFRYDPEHNSLTDSLSILPVITANESHNGSRIVFTPDRKIFFAMGEAYTPNLAQELTSLNGKILRLNPDGSVPPDNPFPDNLVWSFGHRNPQGLALLPNGTLWSSEHGPNNDDELNLIVKGGNYGWPKVQGACDLRSEKALCRNLNVVEPVLSWTPTVAPCALEYYDHPAIPEWKNSLLQVFLKKGKGAYGQRMTVFNLDDSGRSIIRQSDFFVNTFGRLRDVLIAPDGRIFICTSNMEVSGNGKKAVRPGDDKIIELRPVKH